MFSFMKNSDGTDSELRTIGITPSYLTNKKVNIGGINIHTTHEEISKILPLNKELPTGASYYLDEYLTVAICETINDESSIEIDRTLYNKL